MPHTGVIILVHGSRGKHAVTGLPETFQRISEGVKALLPPGIIVTGAALQFNHPDLEEAMQILIEQDIEQIIIVPYFLFQGVHITEDIPEIVEHIRSKYPDKRLSVSRTLGSTTDFISQVALCIDEAVPALYTDFRTIPESPLEIERHSMEIIDKLLPSGLSFSKQELQIVKRIVHASGDPDIASSIRFSSSAVTKGLYAITGSRPIITDVRMVAAGINKHHAGIHGCSIICAVDATDGQTQHETEKITRAAAAMRNLTKEIDNSIVVIGNAPTALITVLELIDNSDIKPALIIGMPVGFVQAKESKYELIKRDIPYITVVGNRGGSAMAAATINALLKMNS
jgi:precorrin-8X/cobalt-precorrin-8 methylmutase